MSVPVRSWWISLAIGAGLQGCADGEEATSSGAATGGYVVDGPAVAGGSCGLGQALRVPEVGPWEVELRDLGEPDARTLVNGETGQVWPCSFGPGPPPTLLCTAERTMDVDALDQHLMAQFRVGAEWDAQGGAAGTLDYEIDCQGAGCADAAEPLGVDGFPCAVRLAFEAWPTVRLGSR